MTQEEFNLTYWQRGNIVRLQNGKEYDVVCMRGDKYLLLYSKEYHTCFIADCNIIDERTSERVFTEDNMPGRRPKPAQRKKKKKKKKRPNNKTKE